MADDMVFSHDEIKNMGDKIESENNRLWALIYRERCDVLERERDEWKKKYEELENDKENE